ncbi:MAG: VOC family protein, partial [Actinomycetota bacterium]|nr:VOC family protein [Actinomycetota bacterium]
LGTVHHVAFAVSDEDEQLRLREELIRQGLAVTEVLDRCYFRSVYFREPGGILFEVATTKPGFAIDEDLDSLGSSLKLPPWEEQHREEIEAVLPPVSGLSAPAQEG